MAEDVDYRFHGQRLLENPAWAMVIEQLRTRLGNERDQLPFDDVDARWAYTVAETMLTKIVRRVEGLARTGRLEAFHADRAEKVA